MHLSEGQIEHLFEFTRKKWVKFEDVRYEIVDHLASGIEEYMAADAELSFEAALKKVYAKFPITGFVHFVAEKNEALRKYWRRKFLTLVLSYFKLPKVILTVAIFLIVMNIHLLIPELDLEYLGIGAAVFCSLTSRLAANKAFRKLEGKYLFIKMFYAYLSGIMVFSIYPFMLLPPDNLLQHETHMTLVHYIPCTIACLFVTFNIIFIIASLSGEFTALLEEEIELKYQHLNISIS